MSKTGLEIHASSHSITAVRHVRHDEARLRDCVQDVVVDPVRVLLLVDSYRDEADCSSRSARFA